MMSDVMTQLSTEEWLLIDKAERFATEAHEGQMRKGGKDVPYITHPLAVAEILKDVGATTKEIVSGLLHDTIEDTDRTLEEIAMTFGDEVAVTVDYVTEADKSTKWKERKAKYITRLGTAPYSAVLVASADKLHNARDTLEDYRKYGDDVWSMFNSQKDSQFWYYKMLIEIFEARKIPEKIVEELKVILTRIHDRFIV
jgi:(p)ppGpp synthase/HD superfamily hydrolase